MSRWRKKPVVIEAERTSVLISYVRHNWAALPQWFRDAYEEGVVRVITDKSITITSLEGLMEATRDTWIIQGVQGELYPCQHDIFLATYEPIDLSHRSCICDGFEGLTCDEAGDDCVMRDGSRQ